MLRCTRSSLSVARYGSFQRLFSTLKCTARLAHSKRTQSLTHKAAFGSATGFQRQQHDNSKNLWLDITSLFDSLKQARELLKDPATIHSAWTRYEQLLAEAESITGKTFIMQDQKMYQVDDRHLKAQIYIDYGFSKAVMGDYENAEPVLVKLIQLSNSGFSVDYHKSFRPNAFLYLGKCLLSKQDYIAAEEVLRHASGSMMDPTYENRLQLMHELAFALERQDKLDEAESLLQKLIASASENDADSLSYAYAELAVIRSKQQRMDEAVELLEVSYQQAHVFEKDHPSIVTEKAIELGVLKALTAPMPANLEEVKALYESIAATIGSNQYRAMSDFIELPPIQSNNNAAAHIASVHLLLALRLAAEQNTEQARESVKKAIEHWQKNPPKEAFIQAKFLPFCAKLTTLL